MIKNNIQTYMASDGMCFSPIELFFTASMIKSLSLSNLELIFIVPRNLPDIYACYGRGMLEIIKLTPTDLEIID